jgi:hypothetical protein
MAKSAAPLAPFTAELRRQVPGCELLRIRRALTRDGRRVFQLLGRLPTGEPVARRLPADTEAAALGAAVEMARDLLASGPVSPRLPLGASWKRLAAVACQRIEERRIVRAGRLAPLRASTIWAHEAAITRMAGQCSEAGVSGAAGLLWAVSQSPADSRARRSACEAARALADAGGFPLEIPPHLRHAAPLPPRREAVTDGELVAVLLELCDRFPLEALWPLLTTALTGARAAACASMTSPSWQPGAAPTYYDTKRSRVASALIVLRWPGPDPVRGSEWLPAAPLDRPLSDEDLAVVHAKVAGLWRSVRAYLGPRAWMVSARQLRHYQALRLLGAGVPLDVTATLLSTSIKQLQATYAGMYEATAPEVGRRFLGLSGGLEAPPT